MKILFTNSPLLALSDSSVTTSPMESVGPVKTAEVSNAEELQREFDAYRKEIAALNKPAVISFIRAPGDRSRAFSGFKKLQAEKDIRQGLVNENLLAG